MFELKPFPYQKYINVHVLQKVIVRLFFKGVPIELTHSIKFDL